MADRVIIVLDAEDLASEDIEKLADALEKAGDNAEDSGDKAKKGGEGFKKLQASLSESKVAVGAFALAVGSAIKAQAEQASLNTQLEGSYKRLGIQGDALATQLSKVNREIARNQDLGLFGDEDQIKALQQIQDRVKDADVALQLLNSTADIATAKGKDLEEVQKALAEGYNGNAGALVELGLVRADEVEAANKSTDALKANRDLVIRVAKEYDGARFNVDKTTQSLKQFENDMGDVLQASGKLALEVGALIGQISGLNKILGEGQSLPAAFATGLDNFASSIGEVRKELEGMDLSEFFPEGEVKQALQRMERLERAEKRLAQQQKERREAEEARTATRGSRYSNKEALAARDRQNFLNPGAGIPAEEFKAPAKERIKLQEISRAEAEAQLRVLMSSNDETRVLAKLELERVQIMEKSLGPRARALELAKAEARAEEEISKILEKRLAEELRAEQIKDSEEYKRVQEVIAQANKDAAEAEKLYREQQEMSAAATERYIQEKERQLQVMREEAAARQAFLSGLESEIAQYGKLGSVLSEFVGLAGDVGKQIEAINAGVASSGKAAASTLSSIGGAGAGIAKALGASAREQAIILATFETAAGLAALATPGLQPQAALHFASAALYGIVAGKGTPESSGAGASSASSGNSSGAAGRSNGPSPEELIRMQAKANADALAARQDRAGGATVFNLSIGRVFGSFDREAGRELGSAIGERASELGGELEPAGALA